MTLTRRALLLAGAFAALLGLNACNEPATEGASAAASAAKASPQAEPFTVLAGSELRDIEPLLYQAASEAGVSLKLSYAGTLDSVERINSGEKFDALLPPNGAYPSLALSRPPLAREKLFYSRVALGVKTSKAQALGWLDHAPTWASIAKAAGAGQFSYAMTNPASSNTGMSALFAVASAAAGKTEDLSEKDVDAKVLKTFLTGQKLTAGSSGWLADAFVKDSAVIDAMVNYEAVILRSNLKLPAQSRLSIIYPQDGVISADYPLMLLEEQKRAAYNRLVAILKAPAFQRQAASTGFLRPAIADVPLAPGLSAASVPELSFPNRLEVIDTVLSAYQSDLRRPATSIFVLDVSGSMVGARLAAMREALKTLAGANATAASARYSRFQNREHVVLIPFSDSVDTPTRINFDAQALGGARFAITRFADELNVRQGTAIFAALLKAEAIAAQEQIADPNRFVSVVLLTDGESNVGPTLADFRSQLGKGAPARIFPIMFGEASVADMDAVAQFSGGKVFDGRKASLAMVFKEIRGYQ